MFRRVVLACAFLAACQSPAGAPSPAPSVMASGAASVALPPPPSAAPVASSAAAPRAPSPPGRVITRSFQSPALGVEKTYLTWLPGDYDAGNKRYPVIYLLHGYAGDETNWVKVGGLPQAADAMGLQAIVVMPDGDDGFYSNWVTPLPYDDCLVDRPAAFGRKERAETSCVRRPRYEDYMAQDLVAQVDKTYRTVADRRGRAIAGISMGGLGALMLAMRHQEVFATAISLSGVVAPLYAAPHPYKEGAVTLITSPALPDKPYPEDFRAQASRVFGGDLANWRAHDPTSLAAKLKDGDLALYFDCGTEDGFKLHDQASYLHEVLGKAGVTHTFELVPGGHSFALWRERLPKALAFAATQFRARSL